MKGIKFQYQSIKQSIDQLLLKPGSLREFDMCFQKIVLSCLKVTSIMMQENQTEPSIQLVFKDIIIALKKAIQQHNSEFIDQYDQKQSDYTYQFDEIALFLNTRQPIPEDKERGDIYKYLCQAEDKQKDLDQLLGNYTKLSIKNKKPINQNSKQLMIPKPQFSVTKNHESTQTDLKFQIIDKFQLFYTKNKFNLENQGKKEQNKNQNRQSNTQQNSIAPEQSSIQQLKVQKQKQLLNNAVLLNQVNNNKKKQANSVQKNQKKIGLKKTSMFDKKIDKKLLNRSTISSQTEGIFSKSQQKQNLKKIKEKFKENDIHYQENQSEECCQSSRLLQVKTQLQKKNEQYIIKNRKSDTENGYEINNLQIKNQKRNIISQKRINKSKNNLSNHQQNIVKIQQINIQKYQIIESQERKNSSQVPKDIQGLQNNEEKQLNILLVKDNKNIQKKNNNIQKNDNNQNIQIKFQNNNTSIHNNQQIIKNNQQNKDNLCGWDNHQDQLFNSGVKIQQYHRQTLENQSFKKDNKKKIKLFQNQFDKSIKKSKYLNSGGSNPLERKFIESKNSPTKTITFPSINGAAQAEVNIPIKFTSFHSPNNFESRFIEQQTKMMKQIESMIVNSGKKNNRKIMMHIQFIEAMHERECGANCQHLLRFYQFLSRKNVLHRKEIIVPRQNMIFDQK